MQFANETEHNTLSKIIEIFDEFTIGEVNETYERYIFKGRTQGQDKSIDAYITALRSLGKTCGFCDCLADSLLRDLIVLGINNHNHTCCKSASWILKGASICVEVVKLFGTS